MPDAPASTSIRNKAKTLNTLWMWLTKCPLCLLHGSFFEIWIELRDELCLDTASRTNCVLRLTSKRFSAWKEGKKQQLMFAVALLLPEHVVKEKVILDPHYLSVSLLNTVNLHLLIWQVLLSTATYMWGTKSRRHWKRFCVLVHANFNIKTQILIYPVLSTSGLPCFRRNDKACTWIKIYLTGQLVVGLRTLFPYSPYSLSKPFGGINVSI